MIPFTIVLSGPDQLETRRYAMSWPDAWTRAGIRPADVPSPGNSCGSAADRRAGMGKSS